MRCTIYSHKHFHIGQISMFERAPWYLLETERTVQFSFSFYAEIESLYVDARKEKKTLITRTATWRWRENKRLFLIRQRTWINTMHLLSVFTIFRRPYSFVAFFKLRVCVDWLFFFQLCRISRAWLEKIDVYRCNNCGNCSEHAYAARCISCFYVWRKSEEAVRLTFARYVAK